MASAPDASSKSDDAQLKGRQYQQDHTWKYFLKSSMAGGISGCFAKTVIAPLDRVKILFQGYRPDYIRHAGSPFGVFKALKQIYETQGFLGLFQGHSAMLLRIFPSAAIRFMAYEQYRMFLIPNSDYNTPWRHFLAGSLAGNTAVLVTYPFEVIRSRLAYEIRHTTTGIHRHHHHTTHPSVHQYGILPTIRLILHENNQTLRGFYKGFSATMYGIVPYAGAAFMFYDAFKQRLLQMPFAVIEKADSNHQSKRKLKVWAHLFAGGMAGMLGQTVAYPFDTIRHRMQLEGVAKGIPKYRSTTDALRLIWRGEGWRGFYVGLSITYWKTMPANAIAFVVYDRLKWWLEIDGEV